MILNHAVLFPSEKEEEMGEEDFDLDNIDPEELKVCCYFRYYFTTTSSLLVTTYY